MPVTYATAAKTARMTATRDHFVSGTLRIMTSADASAPWSRSIYVDVAARDIIVPGGGRLLRVEPAGRVFVVERSGRPYLVS